MITLFNPNLVGIKMNIFKKTVIITTAFVLSVCVSTPNKSVIGVVENVENKDCLFGVKSDSDVTVKVRSIDTNEVFSYDFSEVPMDVLKGSLITVSCNQFTCDFQNYGRFSESKLKKIQNKS